MKKFYFRDRKVFFLLIRNDIRNYLKQIKLIKLPILKKCLDVKHEENKLNLSSGRSAVRLAHWFWEPGVGGSNPLAPTIKTKSQWAFSSVGRASALQADGRGFKSLNAHH